MFWRVFIVCQLNLVISSYWAYKLSKRFILCIVYSLLSTYFSWLIRKILTFTHLVLEGGRNLIMSNSSYSDCNTLITHLVYVMTFPRYVIKQALHQHGYQKVEAIKYYKKFLYIVLLWAEYTCWPKKANIRSGYGK